jgi:glycosyltransferase involved in cell wall biosynthesis
LIGDGVARPHAQLRLAGQVRAGRVTFAGRVAFDDLPAWLAAADICVAPYVQAPPGSPFVNSPVKVFEYMAAGRAIVASRLGQIAHLLADGASGLLVTPGDGEALARAIRSLAGDPALRRRLGCAARDTAVTGYTWRANAARVVAALRTAERGGGAT